MLQINIPKVQHIYFLNAILLKKCPHFIQCVKVANMTHFDIVGSVIGSIWHFEFLKM